MEGPGLCCPLANELAVKGPGKFMKIPKRLQPLIDAHMIEEVIGQLQSGKEAAVFVVRAKGQICCAKVYKEEKNRSFQHKAQYTEGRKVRGSRRARAMEKNSKYGRQERELEWQNTEVDALYLLGSVGVSVPRALGYYEGVLLLEMVTDADGNPAPRLNDIKLDAQSARDCYQFLVREAVKMLCAGYIHGDFSEFNVLAAHNGLVIIDLPQAIQATAQNAYGLFERDLVQLAAYFSQWAPEVLESRYPQEIWKLFEAGKLKPDSPLSGRFEESRKKADVNAVLEEIEDARQEELRKRR